jgi:Family of unknown function (DUF5906)
MDKPQTVQGDLNHLPTALQPLQALPNWVLWKWEFLRVEDGEEKWTKVPYQPNDRKAATTISNTWSSYRDCVTAFNRGGFDGLGLCLLGSGFAAFDVDKCRDKETGDLKSNSWNLLERCDSYAEVTPSGTGIRIIGLSNGGEKRHKKYPVGDGVSVEIYRKAERYITITGLPLDHYDKPLVNVDDAIDEVYSEGEAQRNGETVVSSGLEDDGPLPDRLVELLQTEDLGSGNPHGKYASQSELLFAFLTGCARARVSRSLARDACLEAGYAGKAIHQHCRSNGGSAYVTKQCDKAWKVVEKELATVEARIAQINSDHALVLSGSKAMIMKFEKDGQFDLIGIAAFRAWFMNHPRVRAGKTTIPVAEYWLCHPQRRQYHGIEFAPGGDTKPGHYNLWHGFAVEPREGDCSKFLAHVKDNAASGDEKTFLWIMGWWAQIFQQPAFKLGTALVLRGELGTGKTKIGEVFGSLLGNHFMTVALPRYITGQFNSHMVSLLVLHADEAFWAGDKQSVGALKSLVTAHKHPIEYKGVDPIYIDNYLRLFSTGNPDWMVPAGFQERRWAIFDMGKDHMQDHAYFAAIDYEMDHGGREALLHYLLNFDLSRVNLRVIPRTAALLDQQIESMTPEQAWLLDLLMRGALPAVNNETAICTKQALYLSYVRHAKLTGTNHRSIETMVATFLKKQLDLTTVRRRVGRDPVRCFQFPALKDCRQRFAENVGQPFDWGGGWENEEWQSGYNDDDLPF